MADYSKGIIYTIRSKDNIYVGSTLNFRSRKNKHKSSLYNENGKEYNIKLYKTIRENEGIWDMQPYSKYPCNSKLELTIEEEKIRQLLKADLNSHCCGTGLTKKQYLKQYYDQNKNGIKQSHKQYRDEHKDEKKQYNTQYRDEHKDEVKQYQKQYREQHKNEAKQYRKQKVTCDCGCVVARSALSRHRKTKKHINFMEKLNQ